MSIGGIILTLVIGLVAGLIARAVIPGKQDLGIIATIVLGVIGSVVGNLIVGLIRHGEFEFDLGGWWASIIGAIVVLGIYVAVTGRGRRRSRLPLTHLRRRRTPVRGARPDGRAPQAVRDRSAGPAVGGDVDGRRSPGPAPAGRASAAATAPGVRCRACGPMPTSVATAARLSSQLLPVAGRPRPVRRCGSSVAASRAALSGSTRQQAQRADQLARGGRRPASPRPAGRPGAAPARSPGRCAGRRRRAPGPGRRPGPAAGPSCPRPPPPPAGGPAPPGGRRRARSRGRRPPRRAPGRAPRPGGARCRRRGPAGSAAPSAGPDGVGQRPA